MNLLIGLSILLFLAACFAPSLLVLVLLGLGILLCLIVIGTASGVIIGIWQGLTVSRK